MTSFFVVSNLITKRHLPHIFRNDKVYFSLKVKTPVLPCRPAKNTTWRHSFGPNVCLCYSSTTGQSQPQVPSWKYKLLYDGQCPLCRKEVAFLQKHDNQRGIINFVDISDKHYSPQENAGIDYKTAMGRIHAIRNDGVVVRDVEVFRSVYDALGIGWIYFPTKLPLIRPMVDLLYRIWAKLRLPLTGRKPLN
ncbi:hypothetical protein GAYE_PCTG32G0830 [Galdieria yellowstonensis]|uniref:DUF393 domain-containing protein n=1 Tax=Galdieria yellowstonensis TaxID=3028027 RepID=A0AAV9I430_9RHOD|nr:hypothetical protein GAYE_PCTG32G0830 [Galdieria yellowstonensis]